jgi:hypothetical protein
LWFFWAISLNPSSLHPFGWPSIELFCAHTIQLGPKFRWNKIIRKVRKRRHQNPPVWSHNEWGFKKQGEKKVHWASTGHETQFNSKFGAKPSLPCPCFSWTSSPNHCCCSVYCSYKCSRRLVHLILSLSISYPDLIKFHDFADNSQEGMKHQMRGATQARQGMTSWITLLMYPPNLLYF